MKHYTQLTSEQRYQIYALLRKSHSLTEIAAVVGVHKSTISREIRRNTGGRGYRPKQAHEMALRRRDEKARIRIPEATWRRVEQLINEDWSPEQISLWLKNKREPSVSHESIYQYIYWDKQCGGELYTHLRGQKKRRKRYGSYERRGTIVNQVSIDDRPDIVERRSRKGDWELDTIIGKNNKQAIVSMTERKLRLTYLKLVKNKDASTVENTIVETLSSIGLPTHTLTADNGKEFANHESIAKKLNAEFYFAHPYCSWERGGNENANGLVRQYFPKGTDFTTLKQQDLDRTMRRLNNRPRKCLDMKTPNQVAFGVDPTVALGI
ncbi:MAG: IS30 family transposase [Granulosicoccus sp.]|nr:IS30 family transposase [Granulosicoccus sp.]